MHFSFQRANIARMLKDHAIAVLGDGSITRTAKAIGILPGAVSQWPDVLPQRIADRVIAALVRTGRHDEALALATGRDDAPAVQEEQL